MKDPRDLAEQILNGGEDLEPDEVRLIAHALLEKKTMERTAVQLVLDAIGSPARSALFFRVRSGAIEGDAKAKATLHVLEAYDAERTQRVASGRLV